MQVAWFNHGFNHDHEAGVFSWDTKILKIQISIGQLKLFFTKISSSQNDTSQKKKKGEQSGPMGGQQAGSLAVGGEGSRP